MVKTIRMEVREGSLNNFVLMEEKDDADTQIWSWKEERNKPKKICCCNLINVEQ